MGKRFHVRLTGLQHVMCELEQGRANFAEVACRSLDGCRGLFFSALSVCHFLVFLLVCLYLICLLYFHVSCEDCLHMMARLFGKKGKRQKVALLAFFTESQRKRSPSQGISEQMSSRRNYAKEADAIRRSDGSQKPLYVSTTKDRHCIFPFSSSSFSYFYIHAFSYPSILF